MKFHEPTRAYVARRTSEGKTKKEIIRCLKRYSPAKSSTCSKPHTENPTTNHLTTIGATTRPLVPGAGLRPSSPLGLVQTGSDKGVGAGLASLFGSLSYGGAGRAGADFFPGHGEGPGPSRVSGCAAWCCGASPQQSPAEGSVRTVAPRSRPRRSHQPSPSRSSVARRRRGPGRSAAVAVSVWSGSVSRTSLDTSLSRPASLARPGSGRSPQRGHRGRVVIVSDHSER